MGVFDSLYIPCPSCGQTQEFQSKEGDCYLHSYTPENVPPIIAGDLHGVYDECKGCGTPFELRTEVTVSLVVVARREPEPSKPAVERPRPTMADLAVDQVEREWRDWGLWPFQSSGGPVQPMPSFLRFRFWWNGKESWREEIVKGRPVHLKLKAWRDWALAQPDRAGDAELARILDLTELLFRAHFPALALPAEAATVSGPLFQEASA